MKVYAHKGNIDRSGLYRENSCYAISDCMRHGIDGVEIDVFRVSNKFFSAHSAEEVVRKYRLDSLVSLLTRYKNIRLNLEIKNSGVYTYELVDRIKPLLEARKYKRIYISSKDPRILARVHEYDKKIKLIATVHFPLQLRAFKYYDAVAIEKKGVYNKKRFDRLKAYTNKPIHVWTVNGESTTKKLKKFGVQAIITDYPLKVKSWLKC